MQEQKQQYGELDDQNKTQSQETKQQENKFKIRFATENDVPLIFKFIKYLAEYEKASHQCTSTEENIRTYLFGQHKYAEVQFGELDGVAVGFTLFFHNFSTWTGYPGIWLEELFVIPEYRGKGFGKLLLKSVADVAITRNCHRIDWYCLKWNQSSLDFYEKIGAKQLDEWMMLRLDFAGIRNLAQQ